MESSYIKSMRGNENSKPLISRPLENHLLYIIAHRARRTRCMIKNIEVGEALVGDHVIYGMTRQQYRTALKNLIKWKYLTIRTTKKGTIAKLIDTSTYDINIENDNHQPNHQPNHQVTISQPSGNHQVTTNKNVKNGKNVNTKENKRFAPPPLEEIIKYFIEQDGQDAVNQGNTFFDHFTANGWKVGGKTPMKDWIATV